MAKTANNSKGNQGKGKPAGKPAQRGKSVAKRSDAKPVRGKAQQRPQQKGRGARSENKGLLKFLKDVRIELGKVTWPTRKDLIQSTIVVLVAVAIAAIYTLAIDTAFSWITDLMVNHNPFG